MTSFRIHAARSCPTTLALSLVLACSGALAQQPSKDKTVALEATGQPATFAPAPFVAFGQWVEQIAQPWPSLHVESTLSTTPFLVSTPVQSTPYQPHPVIIGQPELPLLGQAAAQAAQQWNVGLNYQGLQVSYLVVDARGKTREIRAVSKGLMPGERFRIRYTASFQALAVINKATGAAWAWQKAGTAWPQGGSAVQSAPGETVELPLETGNYFVMSANANERFILQVRHPGAKDQGRSDQPNYRQDGARSSHYLQLISASTFPYFEQALVGAVTSR